MAQTGTAYFVAALIAAAAYALICLWLALSRSRCYLCRFRQAKFEIVDYPLCKECCEKIERKITERSAAYEGGLEMSHKRSPSNDRNRYSSTTGQVRYTRPTWTCANQYGVRAYPPWYIAGDSSRNI